MSETIEMKTADLIGPALDWAVAQVEAVPVAIASPHYGADWRIYKPGFGGKYSPSTDWAVGGLLIEKHQVNLHGPQHSDDVWAAWVTIRGKDFAQGGYQPLVRHRQLDAERRRVVRRPAADRAAKLSGDVQRSADCH
jgi:hypothetical protein